jgi:D-alanyl-lipoteichoic acid acyltransferase DltB (MBOAT superfamily)
VSSIDSWFLAIAFGLQIYFDFAGYSNMAIGSARLLGITLPENFRQPYHAATPPEFWSRWHMTLSRWIRDYLFFPINAKYSGAPLPLYVSLIGIMALVGLWHGAGWNYMLWGAMHGVYLVAYRIYEGVRKMRPGLEHSRMIAAAWQLLTLVAVFAAWVPFRSSSLHKAGSLLANMFYRFSSGLSYHPGFYICTLAVALFCVVEPYMLQLMSRDGDSAATDKVAWGRILGRPCAYSCCILLFMLFDVLDGQFIYTQF